MPVSMMVIGYSIQINPKEETLAMRMTISAKPGQVTQEWFVVDATDLPLGRLSSEIAKILRGKHKPSFTPNSDTGDNVIVINAEKVALTGRNKAEQQTFHWHTGFAGGIKSITAAKTLESAHPERLLERTVKRMMPKDSPLSRAMFRKLHVYAGAEHPHVAQQPKALDLGKVIAKRNRKTA